MRLLVTRPMLDAVPLAEALATRGHDVLISPLIELSASQATLPPVETIGGLALTSANGVRALVAACPTAAVLATWQALPAFAVGPQTADCLAAHDWQHIRTAGGDVDKLAALIAAHWAAGRSDDKSDHHAAEKPILHIAGRDRAGDLAAALTAANVANQRVVLYRADAATDFTTAARAALTDDNEPVDGVLVYSARSAAIFLQLYHQLAQAAESAQAPTKSIGSKSAARRPLIYCLSDAVAAPFRAQGFETLSAAEPTQDAMLALF